MKYIACAFASALLLTSCNDFLDKMPDNRTEVDSENKVISLLVSAYPTVEYQLLGEFMSDNVDDYGSGNPYYDQFIEEVYNWEDVTQTNNEDPESFWQACYSAICSANMALDAIKELGGPDVSTNLKECKGEALLCRAYNHFMLANIFCLAYNSRTSTTDLGIPYMTASETTLNPKYERGTVAEVYELIEKDIEEGISLIGDSHYTTPKYHFNTKAAYAFAARFYLYYEKWDLAKKYADLCLGTSPALRDWSEASSLPTSFSVRAEDYIDSDNSCNLLLTTSYSGMGLSCGPYYKYTRYSHGRYLASYETGAARHIYGNNVYYCPMYSYSATNFDRAMFWKVPYLFEYSDPVAGIGYYRSVFVNFSTDECLLNRAEAKVMLGDYNGAAEDLTTWQNNIVKAAYHKTLTPEAITTFFNSVNYADGLNSTIKKHIAPAFEIGEEGGTQECMLQCVLDFRRIQTLHEGMRWFDVKRYNIEIVRRIMSSAGIPAEVTDSLKADDPRRAVQIPAKVRKAGMEANPRNN
jgi:starch-binding outer membrane protein, SusD/RagB family